MMSIHVCIEHILKTLTYHHCLTLTYQVWLSTDVQGCKNFSLLRTTTYHHTCQEADLAIAAVVSVTDRCGPWL